ncbi:hypothetical protein Tco_1492571 [Tanacetum coccineum]
MVELKNLKQFGNVQNYQDQFESLSNKVELIESCAISLFVRGLKDEISMPLRMFKLTTLANAFCMGTRLLPKPTTTPLALLAPNNGASRFTNMPFRKQLTQKELEEKRAKNQCFYYDQRYSPGHKCSGHVYSLEVIGESEGQEECESEQLVVSNEEDNNVEMCNAVFDNCGQGTP